MDEGHLEEKSSQSKSLISPVESLSFSISQLNFIHKEANKLKEMIDSALTSKLQKSFRLN